MKNKRELNISNGFNFRDVGGYMDKRGARIKWHKLVRAAYLSDLSAQDQQLLFDYGIQTVIDLRSDAEIIRYPDRYLRGTNYLRVPVLNENLTNSMTKIADLSQNAKSEYGIKQMLEVYNLLVTQEQAQQAYRDIFTILAESNGGVLIHCATGKDRTGVAVILLLKVLGIPNSVIKDDYLMTNRFSALHINNRLNEAKCDGANGKMLKTIFNLSTVNAQYYDKITSTIGNEFGDFSNYIYSQLEVTHSIVKKLRKKFMN